MAIDSVVIRYLPYDSLDTGGSIGVSRNPLVDNYLATAMYPGYGASTSVINAYFDDSNYGSYSALDIQSAGLSGTQREFEFVTLGSDGSTLEPIDDSVTLLKVLFDQTYAGGVIEVGAYIDGEYTVLGSTDLGIPYDFESGWAYRGARDVTLDWNIPYVGFWTQIKQAQET